MHSCHVIRYLLSVSVSQSVGQSTCHQFVSHQSSLQHRSKSEPVSIYQEYSSMSVWLAKSVSQSQSVSQSSGNISLSITSTTPNFSINFHDQRFMNGTHSQYFPSNTSVSYSAHCSLRKSADVSHAQTDRLFIMITVTGIRPDRGEHFNVINN